MKLRFIDTEDRHEYWLDDKRAKGVTAAAKIPDDTYNLELWDKRMVAIGLASDPDLVQAVAAHIEDKQMLNDLCIQAKERAKAHRGMRRGTAAHRITELHDEGKDVIQTDLAVSVLAGWTEIMDACGFEIVPELMERIVVYPELRLCGKFDRIVRTRKGKLVMLDLKSGEKAIDYPHAIAIQLALYANAPLMAGVLDKRGETETFGPLPDLDKKWGVVIHLPESGGVQAVKIDIEAGWKAAREVVFPALKWRALRRRQLVFPLAQVELKPAPEPWTPPDEGAELGEAEVTALRDVFLACEHKVAVDAWIKQGYDSGRDFNIKGAPTVRRFEIIRAAIAWSPHDEDVVRAALGLVMGAEVQPAVTVGSALGSLTLDEAIVLAGFANDLEEGALALRFTEDGTAVLSWTQPNRAA